MLECFQLYGLEELENACSNVEERRFSAA